MEITLELVLSLLIGLSVGCVLAFFLFQPQINKLQAKLHDLSDIKEQLSGSVSHVAILESNIAESKTNLDRIISEKEKAQKAVATLEAEKKALTEHVAQHNSDIDAMQLKFSKDFELLANRIFEEKSEKFSLQNRSSLDQIINPLKERIADFQKKVEETHSSNLKETSGLRQELKHLKEMSQKMTDEAENLTKALKNDSKTQGNWGEMILANILESSGLIKDREYFSQQSITAEDGKRFQPDVLIKLPDNKWVVVDSKVSLTAYERYISCIDEKEMDGQVKAHILSIKNHMKSLASKKYNEITEGESLDFILMFVPIEPAYLLALHRDQNLFNEAYEKGIVLVSPSTLIASLKIIASTWKHEYQNRNAQEIAKRGKLLLDKFIGFTEDLEKIGNQLSITGRTYDDAMSKLRDGRGSLISQARQLEDLGLKPNKQLSDTFNFEG